MARTPIALQSLYPWLHFDVYPAPDSPNSVAQRQDANLDRDADYEHSCSFLPVVPAH